MKYRCRTCGRRMRRATVPLCPQCYAEALERLRQRQALIDAAFEAHLARLGDLLAQGKPLDQELCRRPPAQPEETRMRRGRGRMRQPPLQAPPVAGGLPPALPFD